MIERLKFIVFVIFVSTLASATIIGVGWLCGIAVNSTIFAVE